MPTTVYQESARRLKLAIRVIALRVVYSQFPIEVARTTIGIYSITLRKLKVEFNYVGEDNAEYRSYLNSEFVLGTDPLDAYYDLAREPSSISYAEATSLQAEYINLMMTSEQYLNEVI